MKKFQSGLSVIEILLGIVIIASILGMVFIFYNPLSQRGILVTQAAQQIQQLASVSYEWKSAQSQNDFNGISLAVLQSAGLLDSSDNYTQKSPWGSNIQLNADTDNPAYVQISMDRIPQEACSNLADKLNQIAHRQSDKSDCDKGFYFIVL